MNLKYLLKFGERKWLERMAAGNLYFSNALELRGIEEELKLKGQGDRREAVTTFFAENATILDPISNKQVITGIKGRFDGYYPEANKLPVFCMFCCFEKDCELDQEGNISIKLTDDIKQDITEHFPKADAVAIISEPNVFINDVINSIGVGCEKDIIRYFNYDGFKKDNGIVAMDLEYMKYLAQDIPPTEIVIDGRKAVRYQFNSAYIYRLLMCKDVFFKKEQEFRFVLPDVEIEKPQEFKVELSNKVEIMNLNDFFNH